jgi:hypothetical protein
MREAAPKEKDRAFAVRGEVEWANIEEKTGRRLSSGGTSYPFLTGTAPEQTGISAGQMSISDLTTDL